MLVPDHGRVVAEQLYAAFGAGDIPGVLSLLAPDVIWELIGPDDIPYFGRYEGVQQVESFFELLGHWCIVESFEVTRITTTDVGVVAEGTERGRFADRVRSYDMRWCHVMRVADGRIVEFTDYLDTAPMLEAWRD